MDNLHMKAVGSAAGWYIPGMYYVDDATLNTQTPTIPANGWVRLCSDGVQFDWFHQCVLIDARRVKRFQIRMIGNLPRISCMPRDASMQRIALSSGNMAIQALGSLSGDKYITESAGGEYPNYVVVSNAVSYLEVMFTIGKVQGFSIIPELSRVYDEAGAHTSFVELFGSLNQRYSFGTPTRGVFKALGEQILNRTDPATTKGWYVATAGALAPAWATANAVVAGELRSNAGNVYAARAAGTTGATAPTGTGSNISDGTVAWDWYAPTAVLTAL
jgi:hypothetical protein